MGGSNEVRVDDCIVPLENSFNLLCYFLFLGES